MGWATLGHGTAKRVGQKWDRWDGGTGGLDGAAFAEVGEVGALVTATGFDGATKL